MLKVALRSSEKDDCLVTIKTWMIYCCVTERQTRRLTASQTTKLKTFFLVLVFPRYLVFNECLSWQNKLQRRTICKKKKKKNLNPRSFSLFFRIFLFPFNSFVLIFLAGEFWRRMHCVPWYTIDKSLSTCDWKSGAAVKTSYPFNSS